MCVTLEMRKATEQDERFRDDLKKIYLIQEWAKFTPTFDTSFVDSLYCQIHHKKDVLSEGQVESLNRIIDKWDVYDVNEHQKLKSDKITPLFEKRE